MSKQCLDIEQMQHLKKLSVDTSKASMVLLWKDDEGNEMDWEEVQDELSHPEPMEMFRELYDAETGNYDHSYKKYCGVFTLQDIIDLLPTHIYDNSGSINILNIEQQIQDWTRVWNISYLSTSSFIKIVSSINNEFIDAAYEMLCWCIENGYIKTNKEE